MNMYAIFIVIIVSVFCPSLALDSCTKQSLCYCETNTNFVDLTVIGNTTFTLIDAEGGKKYAIKLCQILTFPLYVACTSMHGCQYNEITKQNYTIANSSNPTFNDSKTLVYRSANRTTIVKLSCSTNDDNVKFTNEEPLLTYNFVLVGKSACPKDLPISSTTTASSTSSTRTSNTTTIHTTSNTTTHANTTVTTHPPTNTTTASTTPKTSLTTTTKSSNSTTNTTPATTKTSTVKTSTTTHKGAGSTISFVSIWTITLFAGLSSTLF